MSARITSDSSRHILSTANRVRHASTTVIPGRQKTPHGSQIWVYSHLQTNQVVYSLSKTLNNNDSLRQLPFNGKKTVPRALRKDLWSPLAQIVFPNKQSRIGLSAYQKLREYRRLHELQWDDSLMKDKDGKFVPKKKRGRKINDQYANSVADIANVLGKIGTLEGEEIGLQGTVREDGERTMVEVRWKNLKDAEFAEEWSENVVHDTLVVEESNGNPEGSNYEPRPEKRELTEEEQREIARRQQANAIKKAAIEAKQRLYHEEQARKVEEWRAANPKYNTPEAEKERELRKIAKAEAAKQVEPEERDLTEEEQQEIAKRQEAIAMKRAATEEKQRLYHIEQARKAEAWRAANPGYDTPEARRERQLASIARADAAKRVELERKIAREEKERAIEEKQRSYFAEKAAQTAAWHAANPGHKKEKVEL